MKLSNSGITLIELCMAMSSMAITVLAASQMLLSSARDFYFNENQINLSNKISLASRLIETEFVLSGGNFLPPWLSLKVEDKCGSKLGLPECDETDRLTIATGLYDPVSFAFFPTPSVASYDNVNSVIYVNFSPPAMPCPLSASLMNKHILLTNAMQTDVFALWTESFDIVKCTITVKGDNQGSVLNSNNFLTANYASGIVSFVRLRTYFVDTEAHLLQYYQGATNSAFFYATDFVTILRDVYDFQLALGFDTAPHDGQIMDLGSNKDEVLFNAEGDSMAKLGVAGAIPSDLRQLSISLVLGEILKGNAKVKAKPIKNFNGPEVHFLKANLQSIERKVFFRNSMAYL